MIRHLDLVLLALAFPVFLAAGWPVAGWAAGTAIYLVQWAVRELLTRRAQRAQDPRTVVGVLAASMVGRGMASGLALLVVGLSATRAYTLINGQTCTVGRVQTPTLALIVNRQSAIDNFISRPTTGM